jgi:signal transduction histidine kinase
LNLTKFESIPFSLKQLLLDIKNSLEEVAIKNNNNFDLIIDDSIPEGLLGDTTKLSQIFMNLINNGLKFKKRKRNYNGQLGFFSRRKHLIAFKIIDNG